MLNKIWQGFSLFYLLVLTIQPLLAQTSGTASSKTDNSNALLAHIVLQVSDINSSLTFYQEAFGMELEEQAESEGEKRYFLTNTQSHHKLVLMEKKNLPNPDERALQQIAFEVPDHAALVQHYMKLKDRYELEIKDNQISWSLYLKDPDQNKIEIFWDIRSQPFGKEKWNGEVSSLSEEALLRGKP